MKREEREEFEKDFLDCNNRELSGVISINPSGISYGSTGGEIPNKHRGDGGATNYYELPKGATELRHIIKHKQMEHGIGEAFCALYRLNDNGEYLRNLKKAKFYIDCAIEYEEGN